MEHDPEESHQVSQNVIRFGIELASSGRSKCYECKKSLLIFFLFFLINALDPNGLYEARAIARIVGRKI